MRKIIVISFRQRERERETKMERQRERERERQKETFPILTTFEYFKCRQLLLLNN